MGNSSQDNCKAVEEKRNIKETCTYAHIHVSSSLVCLRYIKDKT
jgi:hypothetical protein